MFSDGVLVICLCFVVKIRTDCIPGSINATGVTDSQKSEIVNLHNDYRRKVAQGVLPGQPKASNMQALSWDDRLATLAQQNVSDTCVFEHVILSDPRWMFVGQNLYLRYGGIYLKEQNWTRAISIWFNEYQIYVYPQTWYDTFHPDPSTGHYTQIVNANTTKIGCGFTQFYSGFNNYWYYLYACNYGSGGNILGRRPYRIGPGCDNLC